MLGNTSLDVSRNTGIDRTVVALEHINVVVFHRTVLLLAHAVLSSGIVSVPLDTLPSAATRG